jgi:glycosyltransferase involved in cell wall biosynthesis
LKKIDIVSSALNEENCIQELVQRISKVFEDLSGYEWTLYLFDNGSTDNTWLEICKEAEKDNRVIGLRMTRTFDFDNALTAGLELSDGYATVIMASDLQDPPEVIPDFLEELSRGASQVVARVTERETLPFHLKILTKIYYRIASWATDGRMPQNVSDFRVISKEMRESVLTINERHRFLRGIMAWTGYRTHFIEIVRPARFAGKRRNTIFVLVPIAIKTLLANSLKPISAVSTFAIFTSFVSFLALVIMAGRFVFFGVPFSGFGTLTGLAMLSFSVLVIILGVIAEYVGLIYNEVRGRPHYIIADSINLNRAT